jgi:hypothetical protein
MFFRREQERELTFADRVAAARAAGFQVDGKIVSRRGIACEVVEGPNGEPEIGEVGLLVKGNEIARLVHGGYQMFFLTRDGHKMAALAEHLKALHAFTEDLQEAMSMTSYYNEGLGTICTSHLYDRVKGREGHGH